MESRKKLIVTTAGLGILFLAILIIFSWRGGKEKPIKIIKESSAFGPVVAGQFYPAEPERLEKLVAGYLNQAPDFSLSDRRTFGLIVPHAGYSYSGKTAAAAFKLLKGKSFPRVVILAPSHHAQAPEVSIPGYAYYQTNLGLVPIDREAVARLQEGRSWITDNPSLYQREHSLEVELPFLQTVLEEFRLVPLYFGNNEISLARDLAAALKATLGLDALYIASTDMSHYWPYPKAQKIDRRTLDLLQAKDPEALAQAAAAGKAELCGLGPVLTLLYLFQDVPDGSIEVIHYENSGDVSGKKRQVVGYGALGLFF